MIRQENRVGLRHLTRVAGFPRIRSKDLKTVLGNLVNLLWKSLSSALTAVGGKRGQLLFEVGVYSKWRSMGAYVPWEHIRRKKGVE